MKTLVVETSTETGSVAVLQDDEVLLEEFFTGGRGRDSLLFQVLQNVLHRVGEIDQVIVGVGPGGYSGLRVGISAALGLKLGRGIPAFGVFSVLGYMPLDYQVVIDGRGAWILSEVSGGSLVGEPGLLDENVLRQRLKAGLSIFSAKPIPEVGPLLAGIPRASILGFRQVAGLTGKMLPLRPIYLKSPHITQASPNTLWGGI